MSDTLHIALVQTELYWLNPDANRAMLEEKIHQITEPVDLIVLPEMFTTGFHMEPEKYAEVFKTTSYKWMQQIAAQKKCAVTGSIIIKEGNSYYNRLHWMQADGQCLFYDKKHLFRMAGEDQKYTAGAQTLIVELKGWKIMPLICYDLRFPVWSRNKNNSYDLLLYVANWPEVRSIPWRALLQARAIENLSYVIGVNRVGTDGNLLKYSGDSSVFNYKGEVVFHQAQEDIIKIIKIHKTELEQFRQQFPAHLDADQFTL